MSKPDLMLARGVGGQKPDWRAYFEGRWRVERRIDDRLGARTGVARGEIRFLKADDAAALCCVENLEMTYGGRRFPARQTTIWRFPEDGCVARYFRNGRFFCEMDLRARPDGGFHAAFAHQCGDDTYQGAAVVADANQWTLVWQVSGPRKNYVSATAHRRDLRG